MNQLQLQKRIERNRRRADTLADVISDVRKHARQRGGAMLRSWTARDDDGKRERFYQLGGDDVGDLRAQERQDADVDRAFDLLDSVGSLDDCIAHGLIAEDARHRLTITEAGWTLARSLGWKASQ